MKTQRPAVRKLIYLVIIALLIIPLSLIALPETRDANNSIKNAGGQLSILRQQYNLSQANLADVDPASETMRLASLGLRGVAVCSLWMKAMEQKKTENYDQLAATLKTLTKIQPNFVKVWEYQAHNLAYNVSMEFDDYEYRYHWVKKGIGFLKEGVPYNKTDHRMTDTLGFFTGNKIGKSDEKESFRRMFGLDTEFHELMRDYINPESYETRGYGHHYDNWLMAYQWYDWSRRMVDEQSQFKYVSDMIFYNNRPSARRNQGLSLQREFRPDESQKQVWKIAQDEWNEYGRIEMTNSFGVKYTMEGIFQAEQKIDQLRKQLDEMAPGIREERIKEALEASPIPEVYLAAWRVPFEERDDEQRDKARMVDMELNKAVADIDYKIARQVKEEDSFRAQQLLRQIEEEKVRQVIIQKDSGTINYAFWKGRTRAESSDLGILAREAIFEAEQARQKAVYDDEFDRDYRTKEVKVTRQGALSLYLDAFEKFKLLFDENPDLQMDVFGDEVVDTIVHYQEILKLTGREWPEDFPLQAFLDYRASRGEKDPLPTTEDLNELRQTNQQNEELEDQEQEIENPEAASDDQPAGENPEPRRDENDGDENDGN
jgi:hypothetical protein